MSEPDTKKPEQTATQAPRKPPNFPPRRPPQAQPQPTTQQPATSGNVNNGPPVPQQLLPTSSLYLDPAYRSMVEQVMTQQRPASQKFYIVVLPEDEWPRCEEFSDMTEMVDRIKGLIGTGVCLFPFLGHQLTITEGVNRFLLTPMGSIALFDLPNPENTPVAKNGWVGPSMDTPQAPTEENEPAYSEDDEPQMSQDTPPEPEPEAPFIAADGDTPIFDS